MKTNYYLISYIIVFIIAIFLSLKSFSYYNQYKSDKEYIKLDIEKQNNILKNIDSYFNCYIIVIKQDQYQSILLFELLFKDSIEYFNLYSGNNHINIHHKKELKSINGVYDYVDKYYINKDDYKQIDSIKIIYFENEITLNKKLINVPFDFYTITNKDLWVNDIEYKLMKNKIQNEINPILYSTFKKYFIVSILFLIAGLIIIVFGNEAQKKELNKKKERTDRLKSLYKQTNDPVLISDIGFRTRQSQTRQIFTGALTYSLPKEHELYLHCQNISNKTIIGVEFEFKTSNVFNEDTSKFTLVSEDTLTFAEDTEITWNLKEPINIKNTTARAKRVMFSDGTIWNNN